MLVAKTESQGERLVAAGDRRHHRRIGGTMLISRRSILAGGAALIAAGPALAQRRSASGWFDRAIIIDALGGTGDPYTGENITRMSERGWRETVETGVTIVRDTVFPV